MRRILRSCGPFAAMLLAACSMAQTPVPPTAPLPARLSDTHSIFIGNAGDQENADCLRAYNDFYAGVDALHQFQLVNDPAQADLVVELHYEISLAGSRVSGEDSSRQFRAVLIDSKSHVVLWSLTEQSNYAARQKNRDKNLDAVVDILVKDFASIVSPQPQAPDNKSKAHRSAGRS
jgi:hypothetical protein